MGQLPQVIQVSGTVITGDSSLWGQLLKVIQISGTNIMCVIQDSAAMSLSHVCPAVNPTCL